MTKKEDETMEIEKLRTEVEPWPDRARALEVVDQATYAVAGALLREIKGLRAEIESTFAPIISKAHAAHREAIAQRKRHEAPLETAETAIKHRMGEFARLEQRRQAEARARLEADARKARELEARRQAEARAAEESARLEEAVALEAAGRKVDAIAVLEAPMPDPGPMLPPPPILVVERPKAEGIALRARWTFEVVSLRDLVADVAAGRAPLSLLEPSSVELGQLARASKGEVRVGGVRFYAVADVAVSR